MTSDVRAAETAAQSASELDFAIESLAGALGRVDIPTVTTFPFAVVSVDVGGTKIAAATVVYEHLGAAPVLPWKIEVPTNAKEGGAAVLDTIVGVVRKALDHAEIPVAGIGVGTAGRVSAVDGSIVHANEIMPGWTGQPVGARISEEFGLPVAVLGDVQAHALGEARWGAAQGAETCIVLAPGTGLGGGFICHGRIVKGSHGFAGEVGATMNPLGDGTLESIASGSGIEERYRQRSGQTASGAEIAQRAYGGDDDARRTIEEAGEALGIALAGWANVFDPDVAVVSGSVTKAGVLWHDALRRAYDSHVPDVLSGLTIVEAGLGSDAPLVGAAENLLDSYPALRSVG